MRGARKVGLLRRWAAGMGVTAMVVVATACGDDTSSAPTTSTSLPSGVPANAEVATVVATLDADTVRVAFASGPAPFSPSDGVEVSLIGVTAPGSGQCQAAEADAFARRELAAGATVYLVADAQDTGPGGALLRYVWDGDGDFYNDALLRQGLAKAAPAPPNQRFQAQLGEAESEARTARRGVWGCPAAPSSTRPTTTAPKPTTTRATSVPTTSPRPTAPAPTSPTTTVAPGRTVSLGATFSVSVGETVQVAGEGLSVTYSAVGADSRCRPPNQCIVAGNASISVSVTKAGTPAASLTLNTDDAPRSARYGSYSVELVQLSFGQPPSARLKVT